jgi:predicted molibdopterin-dependent oxidoreductase YjgC
MSVRLAIDGRTCVAEKGSTILQAACANGIAIPTLCDCPGLPSRGSCRMCVVEIDGRANTPTACTAPVEEGMVVQTHSPKVQALRGELLQMLLADHPSSCLFCPEQSHCDECMVTLRKSGVTTGCRSCPKDGHCKLQMLVKEFGLAQANYPGRYRMLKVERNDPFFDRDYNLCVLCGRCIRTCEALHFSSIINYTKRGAEMVVGTAFNHTHLEAGCTFCGACVEVCPTGALTEKTRKWDGTPERETSTTCSLCSIGCSISLMSKKDAIIGALPDHQAGCDTLCVLGRFGITELVNGPARLKQPQIESESHRKKVPWEEAIHKAANTLFTCHPEGFEMLVSTNLTDEDLYVAQKFCRTVMVSENIHSPALDAYAGKLDLASELIQQSQPLSVLADASAIVCLGFDGRYAQSVVEVEIHKARQHGTAVLSINAEKHSPGRFSDVWLRPRPGKEVELLELLADRLESGRHERFTGDKFEDPRLERAAHILEEARCPVFIIGQSFLDQPGRRLLEAIQRLTGACEGQVIALPSRGNLGGALAMGLRPQMHDSQPQVLYVIGESIPETTPEGVAILYQNIYPSLSGRKADLVLPVAAFGEVDGTVINFTGEERKVRKVVEPVGEAWPTWKILSQIAQTMGSQGFEYEAVKDVQDEIAEKTRNFGVNGRLSWKLLPEVEHAGLAGANREDSSTVPIYMGFPLTQRIAGLKSLYPGDAHA